MSSARCMCLPDNQCSEMHERQFVLLVVGCKSKKMSDSDSTILLEYWQNPWFVFMQDLFGKVVWATILCLPFSFFEDKLANVFRVFLFGHLQNPCIDPAMGGGGGFGKGHWERDSEFHYKIKRGQTDKAIVSSVK